MPLKKITKQISELEKEKKPKKKKHKKLVAETETLNKIIKNGYRVETQIIDDEKKNKQIKITNIDKLSIEAQISDNEIRIFNLENRLKEIDTELDYLFRELKSQNQTELSGLVKTVMEHDDKTKLEILEVAYTKGSKNEIQIIGKSVATQKYPYKEFKKALIPILNEYRNKRKQRPFTNLRKHTTEKLIAKIKELTAQKLLISAGGGNE